MSLSKKSAEALHIQMVREDGVLYNQMHTYTILVKHPEVYRRRAYDITAIYSAVTKHSNVHWDCHGTHISISGSSRDGTLVAAEKAHNMLKALPWWESGL